MSRLMTYFFGNYSSVHESQWLKRLLCLFVVVKCIYWLIDFKLLFSENGVVYKNDVTLGAVRQLAFLLKKYQSDSLSLLFIWAALLSALYLLFIKKFSRGVAFVLWFVILNINNGIYVSLSGGDFMLQALLFFSVFLSEGSKVKNHDLDKALHNFGVLALKLQLCMAYFVAGLAKIFDADWQQGLAIAETLQIHDFSLPVFYGIDGGSILGMMIGYSIIVYQLGFPFLIWKRKYKKPLIFFGILQHFVIAFVMGLMSFGFIMIISYCIFYFPFFRQRPLQNS